MSELKHLWEADHPYYMTEGNYYQNGLHREFRTLDDFLSEFGDSDMDYNYVVRWDWLEGEDHGASAFNGDVYYRNGTLKIQFVGQRKALLWSCEVSVCRADESRVRSWLEPRAAYVASLWFPLTIHAPPEATP